MLLTMKYGSLVLVLSAASLAQTGQTGLSGMAALDHQSTPTENASQQPATPSAREGLIRGRGIPGTIARFTGPSTIGDSSMIESQGNLGIGNSNPLFPLHIFSNSVVSPPGQSFPVALFAEAAGNSNTTTVIGIEGLASANNGQNIGVNGVTFSPEGNGVVGNEPLTAVNGGGGVIGLTSATSGFSYGARGDALGATGTAVGVFGQANSPDGAGGFFQSNSSTGGTGLAGVAYSTNGFAAAVRALAVGKTGNGVAVFAVASSADGVGGMFINELGGTLIDGRVGPAPSAVKVFRVDGTGKVYADGGFQPGGADVAESMAVAGERSRYEPGDLLAIDAKGRRRLTLASQAYSTRVAGIYSTKPGLLGSEHAMDSSKFESEVPLAIVGIVPCKATALNGPIEVGDLLVSSSVAGRTMKGTDRTRMLGAVVGKALEPLSSGEGVIQVLVTLQ